MLVSAQSIETIPSITSAAVQATCSSCILEALNPATLTYPAESAQANTTILVAIVSATPYTDSQGRTVSIEYHTEYIPKVQTPVANNATALFSATWTTLGTTLTWPTTYVAYSNFGFAPKCTGSASSLSLPQATDPARLIFPLDEPLDRVSNSVADYLDDMHIVGNGTDLNACSWVVNAAAQQVVRRFGNLPVPFGLRKYPIVRRANGLNNTVSENFFPLHVLCSDHGLDRYQHWQHQLKMLLNRVTQHSRNSQLRLLHQSGPLWWSYRYPK